MAKLRDIAHVIRSKNAGAFQVTFDILFRDPEMFAKVKQTNVLSAKLFARLYRVPEEQCNFVVYDAGCAFKCTLMRPAPSGHFGDTDGYGAQQHVPLLDVDVPLNDLPTERGDRRSAA